MSSGLAGLRRFAVPASPEEAPAPRPAPVERCEFCSTELDERHGHVVDMQSRSLTCACRACYLLFTREGAGGARYQGIPDRFLHEPDSELTNVEWNALAIPVTPAFFFVNSELERVVASYPSPGGATECELDLGAWDQLVETHPLLAALAPDVEALYVTRTDDQLESWLVPIDVCYALVGGIRLAWHGLDGGDEVRELLARFRSDLQTRSRVLAPDERDG